MGVSTFGLIAFALITALTLPGLSWEDDSASAPEEITECQKMRAKCRDKWGECFDRHAYNGDACCQQGSSFKCVEDMPEQEKMSKDPAYAKRMNSFIAGHPDMWLFCTIAVLTCGCFCCCCCCCCCACFKCCCNFCFGACEPDETQNTFNAAQTDDVENPIRAQPAGTAGSEATFTATATSVHVTCQPEVPAARNEPPLPPYSANSPIAAPAPPSYGSTAAKE